MKLNPIQINIFFFKEGEESWFVFDDAYTSPQSFAQDFNNDDQKIEIQGVNKFYKIKLLKMKLQQKKKEAVPEESASAEQQQKYKEDELVSLENKIPDLEEKNQNIKETLFIQKQYAQAYKKYRKLFIDIQNNMNRYIKSIEETNNQMLKLKELLVKVGCNCAMSAFFHQRYQASLDQTQETLLYDKNHKKSLYLQAKCYYKLSYFEKAEQYLMEYLQKFPEDLQSKEQFEDYIIQCKEKQKKLTEKDKILFPKVFERLESEKEKERIRKLNQQSIEHNFKKEKEEVIKKMLNENGYEFSGTEFDLLTKFENEEIYEKEDKCENECCDD